MSRRVHYEDAFENYCRAKGLPYVVVDDAKRAIFGKTSLKSFDFVVYSTSGPNLLVDVKGRKFPDLSITGRRRGGRIWENWITRGDAESLADWRGVFGENFLPVLVFAYWLQGPPAHTPFEDIHFFGDRAYAFLAVGLEEYLTFAKPRSRKWETLGVPAETFADIACDILKFL